jgi:hypothetical protein
MSSKKLFTIAQVGSERSRPFSISARCALIR